MSFPALAGCHSQGETVAEALSNIREATQGCLEVLNECPDNTRDIDTLVFIKTGIFCGDKSLNKVVGDLVQGNNDPFLFPEPPDALAFLAVYFRDDRWVIFLKGTDIRKVARPDIPKNSADADDHDNDKQGRPCGKF